VGKIEIEVGNSGESIDPTPIPQKHDQDGVILNPSLLISQFSKQIVGPTMMYTSPLQFRPEIMNTRNIMS